MKTIVVNYPGCQAVTIKRIWEDTERGNAEILEHVFGWFNHGSGSECSEFLRARVRSLSVNDCVRVNTRWFQCRSVGWEEVTEEYVDELEKAVVNHPLYNLHGAFYCLDQIMWARRGTRL
jgi:hypothetical protein